MGLNILILMDTVMADQFVAKHRAWKIAKEASQGASLPTIDVPKLTKKNWKKNYRAMVKTLGRQKGISSVPLLYVVHEDAIGDYKLPYLSTEKQLTACLAHAGENYNTDREAVHTLLVEHSKESEIASIIERYAPTDEPMTDGMKITNFCNGIKDATSVNYAITTKSDPAANQTFEAFCNSFSAKLTSHLTLIAASSSSSGSINAISQHGGRGRGG